MKVILAILLISFVVPTSISQELENDLLISKTEVTGLIDSLPQILSTVGQDGTREWKKSFEFIDSISVNQIVYKSEGLKINGYIVQPEKSGEYPCIIWNRGGVKEYGALNLLRVSAMMGKLASEGFVVIATQYRGNAGSEGKEEYGGAEIADVLNLIEVLGEIPSADTTKIGMFGGSRGGMMTYIALKKSNRIKAAAVLGAPSDEYASIRDRPSIENSLVELVSGYEDNKAAELDKRSAIKWADEFPKNTPVLIMHGNADWRVKSEQSLRLALELDKYRVPYRLMIFEGGDHGLSEFREEFYDAIIAWFKKYLTEPGLLPNMEYHGT